MRDSGLITVCRLVNTASPGAMPVESLVTVCTDFFEERVIGYNRFYAAQGANNQIDLLVRTGRLPGVAAGMYAVLGYSDNNGQYRIIQVQNLLDDDGLKCTDLTLQKVGVLYDIDTE